MKDRRGADHVALSDHQQGTAAGAELAEPFLDDVEATALLAQPDQDLVLARLDRPQPAGEHAERGLGQRKEE